MNKQSIKDVVVSGGSIQYGKAYICQIKTGIIRRFQVESFYEMKGQTFFPKKGEKKENKGFGFKYMYDNLDEAVEKFCMVVTMAKSGEVQ